ncbi:MAG TPA: prepilin-type N-terminal cleavage/methylation domain-containing protein [Gemmatimonadales bacterium]|jgi:prepilin-type N-terminal cleavage/methylation domain-containing protein|nr:prepilin-type N-terminal cleavage/methylation domain-containing protein [Gemmatimonadales bacterium]
MQRGVTLFELLVVLAIVGILTGLVIPSSAALADRLAVEHQAARILVAYRSAWVAARMQQRLAILRISADTLAIRTVRGADDPDTLLAWSAPGPSVAGVTLTSPARTSIFAPDGLAQGLSNATHVLVKGNATRSVVVSRLGRVRIVP